MALDIGDGRKGGPDQKSGAKTPVDGQAQAARRARPTL